MTTAKATSTRILTPADQGTGAFDGGKITEIKPIPFPQESGGSGAIGPLFYWAWATANGDGVIPMHPHRGFEIVSYVLDGELGHSDTLGTKSRVGTGGAQVMQTGSGVSHQEEMFGEKTEFFQIWWEPDMEKSLKEPATYAEFSSGDFPENSLDGGSVKEIIGGESGPIRLATDTRMVDLTLEPGGGFGFENLGGRVLAAMTVEGSGKWLGEGVDGMEFGRQDFTIIRDANAVTVKAGEKGARLVAVEVPESTDYPLLTKQ